MCEVVKVLERELENSGLIYVYQEGGEGKWYVHMKRVDTTIMLTKL